VNTKDPLGIALQQNLPEKVICEEELKISHKVLSFSGSDRVAVNQYCCQWIGSHPCIITRFYNWKHFILEGSLENNVPVFGLI
jgi:hypothetical protein